MAATQEEVQAFVHKALGDIAGALTAALVNVGDQLGLYRAMAGAGGLTPAELAARTGTAERYVREWLAGQAGARCAPAPGRHPRPDATAAALGADEGPACVLGGFQGMVAATKIAPRIVEAFRTGKGVGWHEHDPELFIGVERFFRPGYLANLVDSWIPALDGVAKKLAQGARVADVGCGHGASTIIMGKAFPHSSFIGFDYHQASIDAATKRARNAGVANVRFEAAPAKAFPGSNYDLVTLFDALHDMGDPVGAARRVHESLAPDGTFLLVEPFANDHVEDNLNPVGRLFYSVSTLVCTPASLSQEVGLALGAQAGERRLTDVLRQAGFSKIRRATETPFNLVLEARP